jgi:N-acetylmuramoyl-L-alanine amidase
MDNKDDLAFLTSSHGLDDIINLHIKGIEKYFNNEN